MLGGEPRVGPRGTSEGAGTLSKLVVDVGNTLGGRYHRTEGVWVDMGALDVVA
jgi:hypothetical protein